VRPSRMADGPLPSSTAGAAPVLPRTLLRGMKHGRAAPAVLSVTSGHLRPITRVWGNGRPERWGGGMDDVIRPSCKDPDCREDAAIAGWCPGHAIARYRRFAVRPTPFRYLSGRTRRAMEAGE
jgi:hypothetical protein